MPSLEGRMWIVATRRGFGVRLALLAGSLAAATLAVTVLSDRLQVPGATVVYLLAVVAVGMVGGTWFAIATAVGAFLVTDYLFVEPRYTFSVASTEEWLHLLLFLVVAIVIGRLTALQLERAQEAERRAAEARAMFEMTRELATTSSALEAAPRVAARLAADAEMTRVWLALGSSIGDERTIADTAPGEPRPASTSRVVLRTAPGSGQPGWIRIHDAAGHRPRHVEQAGPEVFRVAIEAAGAPIGSIWATRRHGAETPGRSATRLLAAAADQLGQAVRRDRLAAEATTAAVAKESDALKTALLDSVSHDLRTPLAGIRAAAGNLMDPARRLDPDARDLARSIDVEAQRLNVLVHNMLDLSRIEAGALHPAAELYDPEDLVDQAVERLPAADATRVRREVAEGLPPVRVDATYLEQALDNLLENALRYAAGAPVHVSARAVDGAEPSEPAVELTVEDGGRGVAPADLGRIFDKFYRGSRATSERRSTRTGMGVGLAVVKGLVEAMGGSVEARQSELGGLAVVLRLPAAESPLETLATNSESHDDRRRAAALPDAAVARAEARSIR